VSDLTFRVLEDDEHSAAQILADEATGFRETPQALAHSERGRWSGAFDRDRLVASTRNVSCQLTLPG
jgi:hypothetical protein